MDADKDSRLVSFAQSMEAVRPLDIWNPIEGPLNIFGPCSAESPEQMIETAEGLATTGIPFVFRAGIWKPRTRPGSFEGNGAQALPWLIEVKERFNIPVITEVATSEHVELCLKAGVDMLWIGARTTANPFSVQELADALKGVDIPVLVKNPIHPDLSLWIGALERIAGAGVRDLGAIHRGFHHYDNRPYRNRPDWEMPIELKGMFPVLPIVCDISHISGTPELLAMVAQRALDLNMDGLLIESHRSPKEALSDAQQQITPKELKVLYEGLRKADERILDAEFRDELAELRKEIDEIDMALIDLLADRMRIVQGIGIQKREKGVTIFQLERWRKILANYLQRGKEHGLSESFIRKLLEAIHLESIEIQQQVMDQELRFKA